MFASSLNFNFSPWMTVLVGFLSVMVADIVWVLYIRWSTQGRMVRAGVVSALLVFNGWVGLLTLLGNPYFAIPAEMMGAFCGTCIAIRIDRGKPPDRKT